MLPELLRFSSSARLLDQIPEELQEVHRSGSAPKAVERSADRGTTSHDEGDSEDEPEARADDADLDDDTLASLGL